MDAPTRYLPEVAWRTDIKDVELVTEATETEPATFKVTIDPVDFNDAGADEPTFEVGFHLTDFEGNIYTATDKELVVVTEVEYTVIRGTFADTFRTEECPKSGFQGIISKSVWKGRGTNLAPIFYRYLDSNALAKVKRLELDMLWSNDPNAKKIEFTDTATPSILNYQDDQLDGFNYHYDYGELPKIQLFTLNSTGQYWERQEKPVWNYVDGLIDNIVFDLSDSYTGYIVISK